MALTLSKEHLLLREMFRSFAEKEVKPLAEEIDEQERFPAETVKKMAKLGFFGIPYPKEYGGQGGDCLAYMIAIEEIAKVCATTSVVLATHATLGSEPIFDNGTEEQKRKYLPKMFSGEWIAAFGLTEANAGSDAAGQQTTAVLDGDHYVLNGSKIFISNAGYADVYTIMAMTDKSKGTRGISAFIVEKDFPGFSVGKKERKMGIRGSSTCELIMQNCIVPKENLLGQEGKGFTMAMKALDSGRIGVGAQALGIGEGAFEETKKYVSERKQFGKHISQFQNTQFRLADMYTRLQAAKHLVYAAAVKKDAYQAAVLAGKKPERYSKEAAMAKLFASDTANYVTREAVQLFGGYGYMREYPVERMMRDAKITEIYEGTSEVQRMVIASALGVK